MTIDGIASPAAIVGLDAALLPFPGLAAKLFPSLARLLFVNPFAPHFFARLARTSGETARFLERSTGSRIDAAGIDGYQRLFATPGHCSGAITMMADWDLPALKRALAQLATPLLLIHGDKDAAIPLATAREAAAMVGSGRLVILPGLGHLAHEEKPEEGGDADRRFCRGDDLMDHKFFSLFDMAIVGIPAIVIGVWQLVSVNREIAKDRARKSSEDDAAG